jgi:hypothetical protein
LVVRRSLLVLLCGVGLGFVLIAVLWSTRRAAADASHRNGAVDLTGPDAATDEPGNDARIAEEMARLRAKDFERASHSLLFSMAEERGVASGLSRGTRQELLDAILKAEGLDAEQPGSHLALQRLRTLADEVGRRESDAIAAIVVRARRSGRQRSKA